MPKKRANGEGSIRKKPNGRWEGRYTQGIDPVTGRAVQKSVSARTRAERKKTGQGHPGQPGNPHQLQRGLHRGGVVQAVV